ncbi:hypothetical protein EG329_014017 [Mollisiaceae sp. DMI_Dod_QoI]|nr:hypothetical protein EG329_014017 [Helotiales sp. DMI_Dod_QoI]
MSDCVTILDSGQYSAAVGWSSGGSAVAAVGDDPTSPQPASKTTPDADEEAGLQESPMAMSNGPWIFRGWPTIGSMLTAQAISKDARMKDSMRRDAKTPTSGGPPYPKEIPPSSAQRGQ